ncbi:MAG: hypothetical protein IKB79_00520 [Oscillospiraceae bacterium]|nr:hypothetical protein [Oscillospiraceae bacterium]
MELSIEHRLTEVEERAKSNQHRIEKLETSTEVLTRLATSMEVMAEKQERVADAVDELDGKVTALEAKPAKRWDELVNKLVLVTATAVLTWLLSRAGLAV